VITGLTAKAGSHHLRRNEGFCLSLHHFADPCPVTMSMHVPGHVRKGSDALGLAGEMLLSGEIYRQSNVVSGLANKRFFVLHGPKPGGPALLCSYRREADAQPSRVWKISKSARCQLTDIVTGKWNLRSEGASTLSALAFGSYSSTTMVSWHGL
jgi:hypothetical protein